MDDEWSADGLSALQLALVRSTADTAALEDQDKVLVEPFSPAFVYPIFGQEETIFGYRDLEIHYRFASGSLAQYLHVKYAAKFPETGDVKADDPEQILYEFIPPSYAKQLPAFAATVEKDALDFRPCGTRVGAYRIKSDRPDLAGRANGKGKGKGKSLPERPWEVVAEGDDGDDEVLYEAYAATWETPGFVEYHRRMQIFLLLFIEGGSYIGEDDSRWEFLVLFERRKRGGAFSYHFVGYTSFYSFFCWPDTKRLRLSQFVILPPYQGHGHGSALYNLAYQNMLSRPEIGELTVEDPSEPFEDMRDKADLHTLLAGGDLEGLSAPIPRATTEAIRKKYKLADRQFYRLVEMILLLALDPTDKAQATALRLTVKKRLYAFNYEQLSQIDREERKVKLQETFQGVENDYRRITQAFV